MKTLFLCILAFSPAALIQDTGIFPLDAVKELGGWGVVAAVLLWQIKVQSRAVAALEQSVEQHGRVLESLEQHMREDAVAFARLHDALSRREP